VDRCHPVSRHNVLIASCLDTGWQRSTGCLIIIGRFSQKSPIISSSFAKNDLQLKAYNVLIASCAERN